MSIFDILSRHPRGDISAQADGELAPDRRDTLEAHLAGCERCRTELDDLLSVRSALHSLPPVAAPRSFTLTPAMAEREPRPVTSRATPSFVAMRVAGAGFAAMLAVVVMLDAGGIVDDTGGSSSDESSTALLEDDLANRDTEAGGLGEYGYDALPEVSDDNIEGIPDGAPPVDDDGSLPASGGSSAGVDSGDGPDGGVGGDYSGDIAVRDAPEDVQSVADGDPAVAPQPDDSGQRPADATTTTDDTSNQYFSASDDDKAAAPESGDGAPAALTSEDDGISSLLVIEIGLAAIAVLAIGGSFVMRRRAESE